MYKNKLLFIGQRYHFSVKRPYDESETTFRANFMHILGDTLIVKSYRSEKEVTIARMNRNLRSIPLKWITKIESLEYRFKDILLPSDILLQIDNYLM